MLLINCLHFPLIQSGLLITRAVRNLHEVTGQSMEVIVLT